MKRSERLRGSKSFKRVRSSSKHETGELIRCTYQVEMSDIVGMSVGFVVAGGASTAVQRNRLKRLMKEAFRAERPTLLKPLQLHKASGLLLFTFKGRKDTLPHQTKFGDVQRDITKLTRVVASTFV